MTPVDYHIEGEQLEKRPDLPWVASRISDNKPSRSVALRLRAGQVHIWSGRGEQKQLETQGKLAYGQYGLLW